MIEKPIEAKNEAYKMYYNRIQSMNNLPINIAKYPDETDEAYFNRISNLKDYALDQSQMIEQNKVIVKNKFKDYTH